jgi:hypothetical protein
MCDGSTKLIEAVKTGDSVASVDEQEKIICTKVWYLPHLLNVNPASFLEIGCETKNGDTKSLSVTDDHLLFTKPVESESLTTTTFAAKNVRKGMRLVVVTDREETPFEVCVVTSVGKTHKTGVYNLLTPSGNFFVNGMLVSSYAQPKENELIQYDHVMAHYFCYVYFGLADVLGISDWTSFRALNDALKDITASLTW